MSTTSMAGEETSQTHGYNTRKSRSRGSNRSREALNGSPSLNTTLPLNNGPPSPNNNAGSAATVSAGTAADTSSKATAKKTKAAQPKKPTKSKTARLKNEAASSIDEASTGPDVAPAVQPPPVPKRTDMTEPSSYYRSPVPDDPNSRNDAPTIKVSSFGVARGDIFSDGCATGGFGKLLGEANNAAAATPSQKPVGLANATGTSAALSSPAGRRLLSQSQEWGDPLTPVRRDNSKSDPPQLVTPSPLHQAMTSSDWDPIRSSGRRENASPFGIPFSSGGKSQATPSKPSRPSAVKTQRTLSTVINSKSGPVLQDKVNHPPGGKRRADNPLPLARSRFNRNRESIASTCAPGTPPNVALPALSQRAESEEGEWEPDEAVAESGARTALSTLTPNTAIETPARVLILPTGPEAARRAESATFAWNQSSAAVAQLLADTNVEAAVRAAQIALQLQLPVPANAFASFSAEIAKVEDDCPEYPYWVYGIDDTLDEDILSLPAAPLPSRFRLAPNTGSQNSHVHDRSGIQAAKVHGKGYETPAQAPWTYQDGGGLPFCADPDVYWQWYGPAMGSTSDCVSQMGYFLNRFPIEPLQVRSFVQAPLSLPSQGNVANGQGSGWMGLFGRQREGSLDRLSVASYISEQRNNAVVEPAPAPAVAPVPIPVPVLVPGPVLATVPGVNNVQDAVALRAYNALLRPAQFQARLARALRRGANDDPAQYAPFGAPVLPIANPFFQAMHLANANVAAARIAGEPVQQLPGAANYFREDTPTTEDTDPSLIDWDPEPVEDIDGGSGAVVDEAIAAASSRAAADADFVSGWVVAMGVESWEETIRRRGLIKDTTVSVLGLLNGSDLMPKGKGKRKKATDRSPSVGSGKKRRFLPDRSSAVEAEVGGESDLPLSGELAVEVEVLVVPERTLNGYEQSELDEAVTRAHGHDMTVKAWMEGLEILEDWEW